MMMNDNDFVALSHVYIKLQNASTSKEKTNILSDVFTFGVSNVNSDELISKFDGDVEMWFLLLSGSFPALGISHKMVSSILESLKPSTVRMNITVYDVYSFLCSLQHVNKDDKIGKLVEFQQKLSNKEVQCFLGLLKRKFIPKSIILNGINTNLLKIYHKNNDIKSTLEGLGVVPNKMYNHQIPVPLSNLDDINGRYFGTPLWLTQKQLHLTPGTVYENVEVQQSAVLELIETSPGKTTAFDILYFDDVDVSSKPLVERLNLLEEYIKKNLNGVLPITSQIALTLPNPLLTELIKELEQDGMPGLIIRCMDSEYKFKKDPSWLHIDFYKHDIKYAVLDVDEGVIKTKDDVVVGKDESTSFSGPCLISYRKLNDSTLTFHKILNKSKEPCFTFKELKENERSTMAVKRKHSN